MISSEDSKPDPPDRPEFRFGEGKISGVLAVFLGLLGLGSVVAMLFPGAFTTPEMRPVYPIVWIRLLIDFVLVSAFLLGMISVVLSRRKSRGIVAMGLVALAMVLGGSQVQIETPTGDEPYIALDWFVLSLFFLALVFVPLERAFARLKQQSWGCRVCPGPGADAGVALVRRCSCLG